MLGPLGGRMTDKAPQMGQDAPRVSPHAPSDCFTVLEEQGINKSSVM